MIYAEPLEITGGVAGKDRTVVSEYMTTMAVGKFGFVPAAAFSVIYFLFILLFCWIFYNSVMLDDTVDDNEARHHD